MIVDSQVHLWKPESPDRPWPPGGAERVHLPYALTYDMLLPMMDEAGVDRVVIVPPSWEGDRIDYGLEAAAKYPDRFAVMGRIALDEPQARSLIPGWLQQPGMLGIRVNFSNRQADWLKDGTADWFWPAAETAGIPVMVMAPLWKRELGAIAQRHPNLKLIIDHMGVSMQFARERKLAEAVEQTLTLAKYPNVHVKLSSAPSYSSEPYPFRDMYPLLRSLVASFGPQRCFWGTDITQVFNRCTYRQRVTHFTQELDFLSAPDKEWIMGRAINECLGWHT